MTICHFLQLRQNLHLRFGWLDSSLTIYKMHQKMPTLETQNAHARGKMPTQEVRHSRQRQHQKPSAWACHQSEVDSVGLLHYVPAN